MLGKFPVSLVWRLNNQVVPFGMVTGSTGTWGMPVKGRLKLVELSKNAPSPGFRTMLAGTHVPSAALKVERYQRAKVLSYFVTTLPSGTLGRISRSVLPPLSN